jgi:6-phosphofructokinase 1
MNIPKISRISTKQKACILTSGGLCPGINVVIHNLVQNLHKRNCQTLGICNGYYGLMQENFVQFSDTLKESNNPGSMLKMNRCHVNINKCKRNLKKHNFTQCYIIGGEGSLSGAHSLAEDRSISVIGIPKTIDNDICNIDHTFGFYSAVDKTLESINDAYTESCCYQTVSLVQTMGRNSGILAATAAAASDYVDILITKEVEKTPEFYLKKLDSIMKRKENCVIVISENCDLDYYRNLFNKDKLKIYTNSYVVRNVPMNSYDRIYVKQIIDKSVDLAFENYTDFFVGNHDNQLQAIPLSLGFNQQKLLDLQKFPNELINHLIN